MDIVEAIMQRKSIRAFRSDPVPQETLNELLNQAVRAPSWANTQPWEFAVVAGTKLEKIKQSFVERKMGQSDTDIPRPDGFPELFDNRRSTSVARMLEILEIEREDTESRDRWRLEGMRLFGAPCAIYLLVHRSFFYQKAGVNVWPVYDCGSVAQNIMLLALKYGLGTIPQAQAVWHSGVIREALNIPDSKLILVGISIGYPDWDAPINQFKSVREPLSKTVSWHGFSG